MNKAPSRQKVHREEENNTDFNNQDPQSPDPKNQDLKNTDFTSNEDLYNKDNNTKPEYYSEENNNENNSEDRNREHLSKDLSNKENTLPSDFIEPSPLLTYIDEGVFHSLILLYILWRIIKTPHFSLLKTLKGNMRSIGILFILASTASLAIFNSCLIYLSQASVIIDHSSLEKLGQLVGIHATPILGHKVDVIRVLNIAASLSNLFRVSAIFVLIGLWLPCAYSFAARRRQQNEIGNTGEMGHNNELSLLVLSGADAYSQRSLAESLSHASIVTFATLYSIVRIPLVLFIDMTISWGDPKTSIFYRSLFYGSELTLAVLCFLILKTRFLGILQKTAGNTRGITVTVENVNLLVLLLLVDIFVNHYINILAIPVEMSPLAVHIMKKVSFVCWFTTTLVITAMLAPLPRQIYDAGENAHSEKPFWRPNDMPRLGFENQDLGEMGCGEMRIAEYGRGDLDNSIIEFSEYRNGLPHGK